MHEHHKCSPDLNSLLPRPPDIVTPLSIDCGVIGRCAGVRLLGKGLVTSCYWDKPVQSPKVVKEVCRVNLSFNTDHKLAWVKKEAIERQHLSAGCLFSQAQNICVCKKCQSILCNVAIRKYTQYTSSFGTCPCVN